MWEGTAQLLVDGSFHRRAYGKTRQADTNAMGSLRDDGDDLINTDAKPVRTRRRILRSLGGLGVAGVLAGGRWLRRTQYLHADRDRTSLAPSHV